MLNLQKLQKMAIYDGGLEFSLTSTGIMLLLISIPLLLVSLKFAGVALHRLVEALRVILSPLLDVYDLRAPDFTSYLKRR